MRGFRVELGEVEATLMSHPEVQEAAVVALADADETRLVAYVAGNRDDDPPTALGLRHYLKNVLPDYMVPARFVTLRALPRTPGGKVDRRSLSSVPGESPAPERPFLGPRTPLEDFLAGLWREVLRLDRVSVFDHFFELGGSSIQGAMLINRLQRRIGEQVYVIASSTRQPSPGWRITWPRRILTASAGCSDPNR